MIVDPQFCQRVVCGAVSQSEAGPAALWACSEAGYAGALGCTHPTCLPYMDELRAKGVCGGEPEAAYTGPAPGAVYTPAVFEALPLRPETQPDEGELPGPPVETGLPGGETVALRTAAHGTVALRTAYCRAMAWVHANPCIAAACVVAVWYSLSGRKR